MVAQPLNVQCRWGIGWIRAFLTNRRVRVVFRSATSAWYAVRAGTPQGAIISPFCFAVYVEPMSEASIRRQCMLQFFADDVGVAPPAGVHGRLGDACVTKCLDHFHLELRIWKMRLGLLVIVFSLSVPRPIPIYIDNKPLTSVAKGKYLGLVLNSTFTWNGHVEFILARTASSLKTIANNIPATAPRWSVVQQLVRALVLPRISYGMPVFAPTASQSAKLATVIARGLHRMLGVHDNPATTPVLVDNGFLSPELDLLYSRLLCAMPTGCGRRGRPETLPQTPSSLSFARQSSAAAGCISSLAWSVRQNQTSLLSTTSTSSTQSRSPRQHSRNSARPQQHREPALPRSRRTARL
jgi:hypothetical protein